MTLHYLLGRNRSSTACRLSLPALALALAGGLLPASEAHAQMNMGHPAVANQTYRPIPAARAKAALQAYFAGKGADVAGGENVARLLESDAVCWRDAETLEMVLDYYEATAAAGPADSSFNYVVENYKGYNPIEPISFAGDVVAVDTGLAWASLLVARAVTTMSSAPSRRTMFAVCMLE